jgi:hypothetical protein
LKPGAFKLWVDCIQLVQPHLVTTVQMGMVSITLIEPATLAMPRLDSAPGL